MAACRMMACRMQAGHEAGWVLEHGILNVVLPCIHTSILTRILTVLNLVQVRESVSVPDHIPDLKPGQADLLRLLSDLSWNTVELTGTELAHQTRAAVARGIS